MPTIAAANNLTIRAEGATWALLNGTGDQIATVIQASPDGLTYKPAFAASRRLPAEGRLVPDQIAMIVVGWAVEDSSWHLGLMVTPELAQTRGGRWCGLARWGDNQGAAAANAGELLAQTLGRPFRLVEPPTQSRPVAVQPAPSIDVSASSTPAYMPSSASAYTPQYQVTQGVAQEVTVPDAPDQLFQAGPTQPIQPTTPPPLTLPEIHHIDVPLMPLPITIGEYTLKLLSVELEDGLLWTRSRGWRNKTLMNAAFFFVLSILFGALSFGARLTQFAPVQPDILPYIGVALTILMLLLMIGQIFSLSRATVVIVDNHQRLIRILRGYKEKNGKASRTLSQAPYEGIEYVLVSHVVHRHERVASTEPGMPDYDHIWPEVWLHLYSPRRGFISVAYTSQTEGQSQTNVDFKLRRPLALDEINTPLHHAAQYMGEMIGVPVYIETR